MAKRMFLFLIVVVHLADGQFGGFPGFPSSPNFPSLPSFGSRLGFPSFHKSSPFDDMFGSVHKPMFDFGSIAKKMEETFKPMRIQQSKRQMMDGRGGTTIINLKNVQLIRRDGSSFFCHGQIVPKKPFCLGALQRVEIRDSHDYCLSENYHEQGDTLCIGNSEQKGLSFSTIDGKNSCSGSDMSPGFMISHLEYKNLCGRLPWEKTYSYYPDRQSFFQVKLPNPDLECEENRPDVCVFRPSQ